jgi:LEA14-like dessication related protein
MNMKYVGIHAGKEETAACFPGRFFFRAMCFAMVICGAAFFIACQTLKTVVKEPVFSIHSVELTNINFTAVDLLCKVNVENPNVFDVPFPEIDWEFFVNENSFITGTVKNDRIIKSRETTVVDIPLQVTYEGLYNTVQSVKNAGETAYRIALGAKFSLPVFGDQIWRLEHSGILPLLKMPVVAFRGIKVKNVSLTRVEFELAWEVENNNTFAINMKELNYDLRVNNTPWAAGRLQNGMIIEAEKKTIVPLTVSLNALGMVREITDIINRGAGVAFACGGTIHLSGGLPGLEDLMIPFQFSGNTKLQK